MKNEGWSYGDLAGELYARGIDPDEVGNDLVISNLQHHTPERAAQEIAQRMVNENQNETP